MLLVRLLARILFGFATLPLRLLARRIMYRGNLVQLPADDAGLNAAKARAVASVPEFLRRLSRPGADLASAGVKAPLPVPGGAEHVWLDNVRYENGEFVGTINNEPTAGTGARLGDQIRVGVWQISDWQLVEGGQLVGGFTIRFFRDRMPARQRAAMDAMLPFTIGADALPPAA